MDLLQAELEKIGFEIEQAHRAHRLPSPPNLPDVTIHEEHENAPGLTSPFDLPEDADTNTNYMVLDKECRYRGIFSTNAEGRVFYVILASGGNDKPIWPHCDVLIWPHLRACGFAAGHVG